LLHSKSSLKEKPFVHVDCASLPKDLIESELFGHEKGAFTNANNARAGLIEAAEDGVLFLDEIAEIPIDLQSKLLGVLERRSLRRIGSTKERPIAAWIIAATNRNIESLVKNGEFRSDLYYRLNVMAITIPALRERDNDVVMLGNYYAEATSKRYGLSFDGFSKGALRQIKEYSWYGNVRELKHLIERAVLLSGGGLLDENMLGIDKNVGNNNETEINDDITLGEAELHLIKTALERTNRNVSKAARELGITRMALRYRIRKYNL
jgi:transcriptional regulator with PAS, ATPase and Fis domain